MVERCGGARGVELENEGRRLRDGVGGLLWSCLH